MAGTVHAAFRFVEGRIGQQALRRGLTNRSNDANANSDSKIIFLRILRMQTFETSNQIIQELRISSPLKYKHINILAEPKFRTLTWPQCYL